MTPYRIKRHRKRGNKVEGGSHMTLVPFIDMLTILVVFLLVHTSDVDVLPNTKNISIPESISDKKPRPTVVVMITKDDLLVDGRSVATLAQIEASPDAGDPAAEGGAAEPGGHRARGRGQAGHRRARSDDPRRPRHAVQRAAQGHGDRAPMPSTARCRSPSSSARPAALRADHGSAPRR